MLKFFGVFSVREGETLRRHQQWPRRGCKGSGATTCLAAVSDVDVLPRYGAVSVLPHQQLVLFPRLDLSNAGLIEVSLTVPSYQSTVSEWLDSKISRRHHYVYFER